MLREHAPLIAVSTVIAIMFYLVFRDLRGLHATLDLARAASAAKPAAVEVPQLEEDEEDEEPASPRHLNPAHGGPVIRSNPTKKV